MAAFMTRNKEKMMQQLIQLQQYREWCDSQMMNTICLGSEFLTNADRDIRYFDREIHAVDIKINKLKKKLSQ